MVAIIQAQPYRGHGPLQREQALIFCLETETNCGVRVKCQSTLATNLPARMIHSGT